MIIVVGEYLEGEIFREETKGVNFSLEDGNKIIGIEVDGVNMAIELKDLKSIVITDGGSIMFAYTSEDGVIYNEKDYVESLIKSVKLLNFKEEKERMINTNNQAIAMLEGKYAESLECLKNARLNLKAFFKTVSKEFEELKSKAKNPEKIDEAYEKANVDTDTK